MLVSLLGLCACSSTGQNAHPAGAQSPEAVSLFVSAVFGPDGKLWRVRSGKSHVVVDYSNDLGKTFSPPVSVNPKTQHIKASGENRPGIAVDRNGRIHVAYPAEGLGRQANAVFHSFSADGGKHFSEPSALSDKAEEANFLQARLVASRSGHVWAFWHDERDRTDWKQAGNAIYYAELDERTGLPQTARKAADVLCECCAIAADFGKDESPVLLARFIYPGGIRDHGLIRQKNQQWSSWRVTFDEWHIEACPEHGPSLSIDAEGHYHIAWFSQGNAQKGLFYARSSDQGQHFGKPLPFGDRSKLAARPVVMAVDQRVVLAWQEFDGAKTRIMVLVSKDGGETWLPTRRIAETAEEADYPMLLRKDREIYLAWNTQAEAYRLIPLD
ncbi:MAG: sialidase family protein [Methylococcaceae bacterium]|nr:sialidase family protein [Methylococcaceae bacterium]